jgi:hypothetical protein
VGWLVVSGYATPDQPAALETLGDIAAGDDQRADELLISLRVIRAVEEGGTA